LRNPLRFSRTPLDRYAFPPRVGAHTDETLTSILDLSAANVANLRKQGAV
jgi:crotonobetainyl-CoA:carnitine CoA-transferase CaiB-like acyl-CoA transferase